jgi:hypothetical protein
MRKFFGFGKKEEKKIITPEIQTKMETYKGQKHNPVEDDGITTESLFKVLDAETGKWVDVRELLGITEDDFKNNPDLMDCIKHMNTVAPLEEDPDDPKLTQKERHFKYFEQLDTLPLDGGKGGGMILANVDGAVSKDEIVTWDMWW